MKEFRNGKNEQPDDAEKKRKLFFELSLSLVAKCFNNIKYKWARWMVEFTENKL